MLLMNNYINLGTFGPLFLMRIMIIVIGSWGLIFLVEYLYRMQYPSITKKVVQMVEHGEIPSKNEKPLLKDVDIDSGYDI